MVQRFANTFAVLPFVACLALPGAAAVHTRHASVKTHAVASHAVSSHAVRGHRSVYATRVEYAAPARHEAAPAMEADRATAIQTALIRAGYLSGAPSGVWDADSVAAMQKLQDDNGWQTKFTPDSRALVKLGLGPTPVAPPHSVASAETAPVVSPAQP